jgi:hypothetical protein
MYCGALALLLSGHHPLSRHPISHQVEVFGEQFDCGRLLS